MEMDGLCVGMDDLCVEIDGRCVGIDGRCGGRDGLAVGTDVPWQPRLVGHGDVAAFEAVVVADFGRRRPGLG